VRSTDGLRLLPIALIVLVSAACSTVGPVLPTVPEPTPSDGPTAPIEPTEEPVVATLAAPSFTAVDLSEPGRPLDAATLLAAMRDSRRPGGVPDQMETDAIAGSLANAIWTFDGGPWTTMAAGGSCGAESCTLEIAGSRTGIPGEDLWVFAVVPATGSVAVVSAELRSLPDDLLTRLDELTRKIVQAGNLDGMLLTSVRWLAPPETDRFVLSYRTGGEEGSCRVDYTLDAGHATIVSEQAANC
jgi:hypothetical protein